jgi:hypothetical protein
MMSLPRLNGRLVLPPAPTGMYCLPHRIRHRSGVDARACEERPLEPTPSGAVRCYAPHDTAHA